MIKKFLPIFLLSITLFSCQEEKKEETKKNNEVEKFVFEQDCTYRIDIGKAQANWTAFKLAEKVGVNGTFTAISIDPKKADSPEGILEGLVANVHTSSVNTTDVDRDKKIVNSFFLTMTDSSQISAQFANVSVTEKKDGTVKGDVEIEFTMNSNTIKSPAKFMFDGSKLMVNGAINVNDFNAQASLAELNKVCEEKHRGDGDKAVTWPDVQFSLSAPLLKKCK